MRARSTLHSEKMMPLEDLSIRNTSTWTKTTISKVAWTTMHKVAQKMQQIKNLTSNPKILYRLKKLNNCKVTEIMSKMAKSNQFDYFVKEIQFDKRASSCLQFNMR